MLQVSLPLPQVKTTLDSMSQKIAAFTDVGNSLAHVQHLLKDLTSFEEKSSVRVQHGWKGVEVIASPRYAEGTEHKLLWHLMGNTGSVRDPKVPSSTQTHTLSATAPLSTSLLITLDQDNPIPPSPSGTWPQNGLRIR